MTLKTILKTGLTAAAFILAGLTAAADTEPDLNDSFVVSQDERFGYGILIPADRIPPGVRVISYADYVSLVREGSIVGRKLALQRETLPSWTIGVFR